MTRSSDYVLGLADDALVSAQRMGWWISRAPELEEDLALANIGLDQLGQARTLLSYAGAIEGAGRTEDDLAYLRDDREFRNVWLVERPQTDFGVTMARLLVFSTYQCELYAALASSDRRDAWRASRARRSRRSPTTATTPGCGRCGSATAPRSRTTGCRRRSRAEWPYVEELFAPVDGCARRPAVAADRRTRPGRGGRRRGDPDGPAGRAGHRGWPARPAHRAPRAPARRDAAPAPLAPGGDLVMTGYRVPPGRSPPTCPTRSCRSSRSPTSASCATSPRTTRAGCTCRSPRRTPAARRWRRSASDLVDALTAAGYQHVDVEFVLAPAWTTDWMTEEAKAKLAAYGVAPPGPRRRSALSVRCPQCGSLDTRESSRFGSTACKSLWVCRSCREPFDHFKAH